MYVQKEQSVHLRAGALGDQRPQSPRLEFQAVVRSPTWVSGILHRPLQEQRVLLTTDLSLRPRGIFSLRDSFTPFRFSLK